MTAPTAPGAGDYTLDLSALGLADGDYEYDLLLDGNVDSPLADPRATTITRFGGYRGVFRIVRGAVASQPFRWDGETSDVYPLSPNEALVIYELPVRWVDNDDDDQSRHLGLGTFDKLRFEGLDRAMALGVNAIELLPVADSPDTINWGYGTRFFLAPDVDLGTPTDLRFFVKSCHQRGIRVLLDIVMYFSRQCPLEQLGDNMYYLTDGELAGRQTYGGRVFRYWSDNPPDPRFPAREFQFDMGELWVRQYHIDGFRIDAFADIGNWEFVQQFADRVWAAHQALFGDTRPFLVVAEDSATRAAATQAGWNGRRVVDAIWSFTYRDDARRFLTNAVTTSPAEPARSERLRALVSASGCWDEWQHVMRAGFTNGTQVVPYLTSHDVSDGWRLMTVVVLEELRTRGLVDAPRLRFPSVPDWEAARRVVDREDGGSPIFDAVRETAVERATGAFALLLTSVGMPMLLAGEEFGDTHDTDPDDWHVKMSDPVNWRRATDLPGHAEMLQRVSELVALRVRHPTLRGPQLDLFYIHPAFDQDGDARVFAYARTGGGRTGGGDQVIVVGNLAAVDYPTYVIPAWPWGPIALTEHAVPLAAQPPTVSPDGSLTLSLRPFQLRVFTS